VGHQVPLPVVAMEIPDIKSFLSFYRTVRKRTRAVAACIPGDRLEWRPTDDLFGPGDLVRHIAASERFMYVENVCGRQSIYPGHGPELAEGLEAVLDYLDALHVESVALLADLAPEQIQGPCRTVAGAEVPVWLLLRVMIEHEIHHRGQLYTLLGLLDVERPSLFGLTEREVFEASSG
jgi:uncharacterized damage-inducible protein DinB